MTAELWQPQGRWHAHWIRGSVKYPPVVTLFHLTLTLDAPAQIPLKVSGDERFEFYVNGTCVVRGPDRGDGSMWHYHTVNLDLPAGSHHLAALVWSLGDDAAFAQMGKAHGLIVAADGSWAERIDTGHAAWQSAVIDSYTFVSPKQAWGTGSNIIFDANRHPWGWQLGQNVAWQPCVRVYHGEDSLVDYELGSGKHLKPAPLPAMRHDARRLGIVRHIDGVSMAESEDVRVSATNHQVVQVAGWQALLDHDTPLIIAPHQQVRVIVDIDEYVCAYPHLVLSGGNGAQVRVHWDEALTTTPDAKEWFRQKGNRNDIEGKFYRGVGDLFIANGAAHVPHTTLWWQAGRYLEICVQTGANALTIEQLRVHETGYPFQFSGTFDCDDQRLTQITPMMQRVLQMCAHETYMDCPYYEQLMYIGDTRLEALVTHVLTSDDRLPAKAIRLFHASRLPTNLTQSRYPSRVQQIIPTFSLWWIAMLHDTAYWRPQLALVRDMLPAVRNILDAFLAGQRPDGLINPPPGWNFVDWVPGWQGGLPPTAHADPCATINWQLVYTLHRAAELEEYAGDAILATRWRQQATHIRTAIEAHFWDAQAGVYRELLAPATLVTEHAQCLAILSGVLDDTRITTLAHSLRTHANLAQTTIYFSHYLFEAYRVVGAIDLLFERLKLWFTLHELGFKTTMEMPEPSRSDCHAWGSHPYFHYHATLVGVRPSAPAFASVRVTPQLGPLQRVSAVTPHPAGAIHSTFWRDHGVIRGRVQLPAGVSGEIVLPTGIVKIAAGGTADL